LAAAKESCAGVRRTAKIFPIAVPRAALREGQYLGLLGRSERSRRALVRSAEVARSLGMEHDLALAELSLGQHIGPAVDMLGRLGAKVDLERALRRTGGRV
jgi:hypothetical protein